MGKEKAPPLSSGGAFIFPGVFSLFLPVERPDGADEGRLAVAVVPGDAGGVDAVEVEWGHAVPVGHEVAH